VPKDDGKHTSAVRYKGNARTAHTTFGSIDSTVRGSEPRFKFSEIQGFLHGFEGLRSKKL